jgi:peptidoglycan/LPS O-acetylase OafA/YrhL
VRNKSFDHLTYRADIDGLRAVAVLSVVTFHAWPTMLPSGFIGVDIFFVISGFLISSIIFKAVDQDSFSFKDFYSRRIKRIFPALGLVFVACLSMGWFALFADEYKMLGKHVASGAVFISNFTLLKESGYFDPAAELKPLLHLWSLGIEEQFYIVWPLLVYAAAKLRINLLVTTILLAVLSFGLNIGRIDAHVVQTFYSPITRIWELMLGALLAYITLYSSEQYRLITKKFANCIAITGLVLIVMALSLLNDTKLFPGWWAALPTVGGVLLIAAGPSAWVNRKVLASHPLVFIGLISYPLYLWHWPLLSFLRIIESSDPSPFLVFIAVLISVLLAWLTYFLVEKRIRHHSSSWVVIGLVIAVAISGCIGKVIQRKDGLPDRPSFANYKEYEKKLTREAAIDDACLEYIQLSGEKMLFDYCRASNLKARKWIAIIGDSHAHVLFSGFSAEFEKRGLGTILLANSSCPPFLDAATGKTDTETILCSNKIEQILSSVAKEKNIEKILIATRGPVYITGHDFGPAKKIFNPAFQIKSIRKQEIDTSREIFFSSLNKTIGYIIKNDKKVAYFMENPELGMLPKNCLGRPLVFSDRSRCAVNLEAYKIRMDDYRAGVSEIKKQYSDLLILDPESLFCDTKVCTGIKNDKLLYADDNHFSDDGSRYVGANMAMQLLTE